MASDTPLFDEMIPDEERVRIFMRNEKLLTLSRITPPIGKQILEKVGIFVQDMPSHIEKIEKAVNGFSDTMGSMQKDGENLMSSLDFDLAENPESKKKRD